MDVFISEILFIFWYVASEIFLVNGDTYIYTYLLENFTDAIQTYDILCATSLNVVSKYEMVVVAPETRWPSETKIICFFFGSGMLGGILTWSTSCRILYDLSHFGYICMMIHVFHIVNHCNCYAPCGSLIGQ